MRSRERAGLRAFLALITEIHSSLTGPFITFSPAPHPVLQMQKRAAANSLMPITAALSHFCPASCVNSKLCSFPASFLLKCSDMKDTERKES